METTKYYCRDIFSLSNQEIIALVNLVYDDANLDRLAHCLYAKRPSLTSTITYRKIEVLSSYYEFAYVVKVSFGLTSLDRIVTSGFMVCMEGSPGDETLYERDVCLGSVKDFYRPYEGIVWETGIADNFGIELDYSIFTVYHKKLNNFLSSTLKIWNGHLPYQMYSFNPQLKSLYEKHGMPSFIVEEVREPETAAQSESI